MTIKIQHAILSLSLAILMSCAGVLKNLRTSSTSYIHRAPYYVGQARPGQKAIGHLPVTFDKRLGDSFFDSSRRQALIPMLKAMNAFLNDLGASKPVPAINLPLRDAPDVYVGNEDSHQSPVVATNTEENNDRIMIVYRYNPSNKWKEHLLRLAKARGVDYVLYITLGFSEYFVRQKNLLGSKELELGTGYVLPVKWLTDVDTPVEVLHVTGALLDKNGKIVRAGAEGIVARQTGFLWSLFEGREMITAEDIKKLLQEERRQDLSDKPLAWQVALQNLVAQLTGRMGLIVE